MGSGPALAAFNPSQNYNDVRPTFVPGETFENNGVTYKYALFDNGTGNVASAAGGAAYLKDNDPYTVTSDKTDSITGAAIPAGCAGIFQGVVTDGYFTWLVVKGQYTVRLASGDSNGTAGNKIFAPASDADLDLRSEADSSVAAAEIPATEVGRQLAAGASNTALVMLNIV